MRMGMHADMGSRPSRGPRPTRSARQGRGHLRRSILVGIPSNQVPGPGLVIPFRPPRSPSSYILNGEWHDRVFKHLVSPLSIPPQKKNCCTCKRQQRASRLLWIIPSRWGCCIRADPSLNIPVYTDKITIPSCSIFAVFVFHGNFKGWWYT